MKFESRNFVEDKNIKILCFLRRSSIAPVANPESACFIFQNGSLQPIAISLAPVPSSSSNQQQSTPSRTPSVTPQNNSETKNSKASSSNNSGEVLKSNNKRDSNGK